MKSTYTAAQLAPYRSATSRFLVLRRNDPYVLAAEQGIALLVECAGPGHRLADLPRLSSRAKVQAALVRIRNRGVPARKLLIIALTISAAVMDDPIRPIGIPGEFRRTQIGKRALRTSSGYHANYGPYGRYDRYPRSAGRMLRQLGKAIEEAADPAMAHLGAIIELKRAAFPESPSNRRTID